METIDLLKNRMSLRKYAEKPISREDLNIILDSAMRAPSAGNMMLYSILVIKDEEKKKTLSKTCDNQPFIASAPVVLIFLADMQRWFDYYNYCEVKEYCNKKDLEFDAPDEGDLMLAIADAVIAAQNAVIAGEALNIGSCYIGDIIENWEIHRELLKLPEWVFPAAMLCMGYYPEGQNRIISPRFDKEYIVFDEEYKRLSDEDFKDMYIEREKRIAPDNKAGASNFGQFMYARKTGADFSIEMTRSVREILKNWRGNKL
ncbi:nitroreductase family protein [Clostridium swellfunianum]|uniref:nitroreductase family protein n=1 Tax=Clostridium swellfunianum TaxID=1367462 RepID=UPI002030C344|nr:nitroreductase family protein [Clostridium swellfunianum]MCM0647818.1 nitroreductase family protein [Clostridium swellfunianum]